MSLIYVTFNSNFWINFTSKKEQILFSLTFKLLNFHITGIDNDIYVDEEESAIMLFVDATN